MKKQNILLVLKILETYSDKARPMTQTEITDYISPVYPCDRKTVGRNIKTLTDLGYPIVKTSRGFYLDNRVFTAEERDMIIASVQTIPNISDTQKSSISERLSTVLSRLIEKNPQK